MAGLLADADLPLPPRPGQMVTGVVLNKHGNRIVVEIAGAYPGIILGREAIDGLNTAKELNVGDEVSAYVVEDENDEGYYMLSLRKAGREKAWTKLLTMQKSKESFEVRIKEANKGGLMTEVSGIRAFIPVSQLAPEHYPRVNGANAAEILRRLQSYVGEKFTVCVITAERDEDKLILSEREAVSERRTAAMKNLKVGQKVKGRVSGIVNFGIFILFDDVMEGLVHLSEIDWGHVADPAAHARLGEEKEAIVIGVDGDKISLSVKRTKADPWAAQVADLKTGSVVSGKIVKLAPSGALVELREGVTGLIPAAQITNEKDEVTVEEGQTVETTVKEIDLENHRVLLQMTPAAA